MQSSLRFPLGHLRKRSLRSIPTVSYTHLATIKVKGVTYKVTKIADNSFKNNNKITKMTIGENIVSIGTVSYTHLVMGLQGLHL